MKNLNTKPKVSIIVVNHNGKNLLKNCFSSLYELDYPEKKIETIMIDNCSKDNSAGFIKKNFPRTVVLQNRVNNFCSANNLGIKQSKGECIAILNNDTEVDKKWLSELVKVITMDNRIAAVGSKVLFKNGRIQSTGQSEFPYHYWGDRGLLEPDTQQYDKMQLVPSISNCSALYRKGALNDVGFFDEDFNMYMEDVDICLRLRNKNWKIFYAPDSRVYHKLHGSGQDPKERAFYIERNRLLFIAKHFPEELATNLAGYGEISKLNSECFHELLIAVFNKLVKHQGLDKANKIFLTLNQDIRKVVNYSKHILQGEKDRELNNIIETKDACINEKNKQLNDLNVTVRIQDDKLNHLDEELKARDKQIGALNQTLNETINAKDVYIIEKEKQLADLNATIRIQEDKLIHLDEELKARDKHITVKQEVIETKDACINEKDKQLNDLNVAIRIQEDKLRHLDEELKARDKQIQSLQTSFNNELQARDKQIGSLNQILSETINARDVYIIEKEKQVADLNATIRIQEDKLRHLDEEVKARDEEMRSLQVVINEKERQLDDFNRVLKIQEDKISHLGEEIKLRDENSQSLQAVHNNEIDVLDKKIQYLQIDITEKDKYILHLNEEVKMQSSSLTGLSNQLAAKEKDVQYQKNIITETNKRILELYNSETYRLIVKPIVWPLFSLIKNIIYPIKIILHKVSFLLHRHDNRKTKGVYVSQLLSKSIEAKYLQKNEYTVKIFNSTVKAEKSILIIDIWPHKNPSHPDRHYCYFSTEVAMKPKRAVVLKFIYDWDRNSEVYIDGKKGVLKDFWRGTFDANELYRIDAYLYENGDIVSERLSIVQRFIK